MDIQLSARIAAPPEAVWGYVTDPAKMNEWSLAPIRLLETGDGGVADGVGDPPRRRALELQDAMTNRRGYDVPNRRAEAFERGRPRRMDAATAGVRVPSAMV